MSQTCSPLPTLEQFDLLTANSFQIAPSPDMTHAEIMAALDADTQVAPSLTFKGRLSQLMPEKRFRRLNWCRSYWQWFTDGVHKWCKTSTPCDLVIACPACALYQAKEQQAKYDPLYAYIPDTGFTRLSFPLDMTDPKKTYDRLMKHLKAYLPKRVPLVAKVKPASDRIETLFCGPAIGPALSRPRLYTLPCSIPLMIALSSGRSWPRF